MNGTAPLVSVIMPTRNRSRLLQRAVASVLGQTWRDLELIVVDDASTDDTTDVLTRIQAQDGRVRVIHRETNRGAAAARNAGLSEARGKYVAYQDDDDFWLVEKIEKQVRALEGADAAVQWCMTGYIRIEPHRSTYVGGPFYIDQFDYRGGIGVGGPEWSLISTPGWVVRRDLLARLGGFDEDVRSWDDWELGLRLWKNCRFHVIDEPLWIQDRIQGAGLTKAERARGNDLRIIMRKHGELWAGRRDVLARHWYTIGRIVSLYDPAPAGRAELLAALRIKPWAPKTWAALAMTYLDGEWGRRLTRRIREARMRRERRQAAP